MNSILNIEEGQKPSSIFDIEEKIQNILNSKFFGEKRIIKKAENRLQFACPYCGDSKNENKKRGNLYLDTLKYKCFNCGIFKNLNQFLNDFNEQTININFEIAKSNKITNIYSLLETDKLSKFLFSRDKIKNKYGFIEIKESKIAETYLNKRKIYYYNDFLFNDKFKQLIILNNDVDNNILGFITRTLNKNKKITSYKLSEIYKNFNLEITNEVNQLDKISLIFNILKINFYNTVTVFEGPIDSFFMKNSIAISGVAKHLPFEMDNLRFMFDNDSTGIKMSIDYLKNGYSVFLWKKFLNENKLNENIKDLNELVCKINDNKKFKNLNFDKYFSNEKLDIFFI